MDEKKEELLTPDLVSSSYVFTLWIFKVFDNTQHPLQSTRKGTHRRVERPLINLIVNSPVAQLEKKAPIDHLATQ